MIKILFTAPRFHTNQHYPVMALIDAGYEVAFFALRRGGSEEYSVLTPTVLGYSQLFSFINNMINRRESDDFVFKYASPPIGQFIKKMMEFNPSIVVVRNPNTLYGFLSIIVAKVVGAKVIFYTQGPLYRKESIWNKWIRSFFPAIFGAQWITPVLGDQKAEAKLSKRWHYVPFVVQPMTSPKRKVWFRDNNINIITVGKFVRRKNHDLLVRAIKNLRKSFPVKLTLVGECTTHMHRQEFNRVKSYINELGIEDIVDIRLNLSFWEVQELYSVNDLYVLPSRDESAAVSILEAMANSIPVICSDSCGTKYYIKEGKNGYVFKTDNYQDLLRVLKICLLNLRKLTKMGEYSYRLAVEKHGLSEYTRRLSNIICGVY